MEEGVTIAMVPPWMKLKPEMMPQRRGRGSAPGSGITLFTIFSYQQREGERN